MIQAHTLLVRRMMRPPPLAAMRRIGAGRALVPVILDLPQGGRLQFRLAAEPFTHDARFRAIYYFPADEDSMRQCVAWSAESPPA